MTYNDAMNYIDNLVIIGKKAGLENITHLLNMMGNPQDKLKFVHIAGTNGKGSTTAMTASVLAKSGYKTGMFISPYIINFRERIQINGEMISEDDFLASFEIVKPLVDKMNSEGNFPNHFEVVTAVAMNYFLKQKCDIVVLEVGLGGRFDATNVIKSSEVSAITSISLDHINILGDTIAKIAFEKCGIIKENAKVVSYYNQFDDALKVIKDTVKNKNAKLYLPEISDITVEHISVDGIKVNYKNQFINIPFIAKYQVYNFLTASKIIEVLKEIGYKITDKTFKEGIEATKFPVRMEVMRKNPIVIIDGAHNIDGAKALSEAIDCITNKKVKVIMGMLKDKDYHHSVEIIAKKAKTFTAVTPISPRALDGNEILQFANKYCENINYQPDLIKAYEENIKNSNEDDIILICGSLYLAGEIRNYIINKNKE